MSEAKWSIIPYLNRLDLTQAACADALAQGPEHRVLLIDKSQDPEIQRQARQFTSFNHPRVLLWVQDPPLTSLSATWNQALNFVWATGATEALVLNNDVRIHHDNYTLLLGIMKMEGALFVTATGVTEPQYESMKKVGQQTHAEFDGRLMKGGPGFSNFLISKECHQKYRFDEGLIPAFCLVPETLVLKSDLTWVPIGKIQVGDMLVGTDEYCEREDGEVLKGGRRLRPAYVTSVHKRIAPCVRIEMNDGRHVICSTDHKWLAKRPVPINIPYKWRRAETLIPGCRISTPLNTWKPADSFDEGWLAGMYDGEGCNHISDKLRGVTLSQKEGPVLERVKYMLGRMGIPYTWRVRPDNSVAVVEVNAHRYAIELLGRLRPTRLNAEEVWKSASIRSRLYPAARTVVKNEPWGQMEVVSIETTTHTYIANGMVSHNCEDVDYHRRMMLGGDGQRIFGTNVVYLHIGGQTAGSMNEAQREGLRLAVDAGARAHYLRKWGGPVNEEVYPVPFECESAWGYEGPVRTPDLFDRERMKWNEPKGTQAEESHGESISPLGEPGNDRARADDSEDHRS